MVDPRFIAAQEMQRDGGGAPPDPPSITSATPSECKLNASDIGDGTITLAGTGFTDATDVSIHSSGHGGIDYSYVGSMVVNSDIEMEFIYPGDNDGPAEVTYITVTTPWGTDTITFRLLAN